MNDLVKHERERLAELEDTVERGLETFVEVGRALMEIRDQRLYRADYDTFEAYCRERWGWGRHYANRQIKAAETVEVITGDDGAHGHQSDDLPAPTSERVARPLTKLPEEEQAEAWEEAVETAPEAEDGEKRVTANHVEETVAKRSEASTKKEDEESREQPQCEVTVGEVIETCPTCGQRLPEGRTV